MEYLYRAVDKAGDTLDFMLRAHRDYASARRFFEQAIVLHCVPEKITIDKSGANTAAIEGIRSDCTHIELRPCKYLNNIVEQDHRAIKRIVRPMLGFKSFRSARALIAGIETMHMIKKGQLAGLLIGNRHMASLTLYTLSQQNVFSRGITPCLYIHCSKEPLWPAAASLLCWSAVPWLWAPPRSHPCAASTSRTTVRPMS